MFASTVASAWYTAGVRYSMYPRMRASNIIASARVLKNQLALKTLINYQFTFWQRSFTTRFIESAVSNHMPNILKSGLSTS